LAVLVYANALFNPFVYDDYRLILENTSVERLADWRGIVVHEMTRPVVNFSYALDYAIWGGRSPFGFHVTNVLIHAVNVALLFQLVLVLATDAASDSRLNSLSVSAGTTATAASVLFAVHPALTQAVGYVSARSELICTTFFLIAFLAARRALKGEGFLWWIATAVAWALSLASRETAATFPLVLCCYDSFTHPASARRGRRLLSLYVPLILLALGVALLRLTVLANLEHPGRVAIHWRYGLVELEVLGRYLLLMVMPVGQTIFHAIAPIQTLSQPRAILALMSAGAFVLLIIGVFRANRLAAFGLAWFALVVLPASLLVMLDRAEPMAEHRVYLASAGLFLSAGVAAAAIAASCRSISPTVLRQAQIVAILITTVLSIRTVSRNTVWSRPVALWLEAAEKAPDHWLPRLALGDVLHEEGRHEEAISVLRGAVSFRPEEGQAYAKLGRCLLEAGHLDEANSAFQTLLRLNAQSPAAYGGLGLLSLKTGQTAVARQYFLDVLDKDPESIAARQILASLEEAANPRESLRLCEEIRQLAPLTEGNDDCINRNRARLNDASPR
jgi:protein O-mannosyl-transferase